MNIPTKSDWLVAEVLVDQNESFVLWAVKKQLCSSRDDFRAHFGPSFPANDIVDSLEERGFIQDDGASLVLTEFGSRAVRSLLKDNPASELADSLDAKLTLGGARAESISDSAESLDLPSVENEIAKCTAALRGQTDLDAAEYGEDEIREYLLVRLNLLLFLRDGYLDFVGEWLARMCPGQYQRSLALTTIRCAQATSAEKAFKLAKSILKQFIDPEVLGHAVDIGSSLGRVRELEEAVLASRRLKQFGKQLRSASGVWTHAYLERIGLVNLSRSLKQLG